MTLAKVDVTPVTQVAADAGDTSAVLRLPTVSAARSVWFEADANSASRTAARRGTIVCFGLAIRPPLWTCPEHCRNCLAGLCKTRGLTVHSVEFIVAVVRVQQSGLPGRTQARTSSTIGGAVLRRVCSGKVRSAPWERPISHRPGAALLARANEMIGMARPREMSDL